MRLCVQLRTLVVHVFLSTSIIFILLSFVNSSDALHFDAQDTRPPLSLPRIAKYCNPAHYPVEGQEGLVPPQYKLLAVQTVTRHGDRSPADVIPQGISGNLSCMLDTDQFAHLPKVVHFPIAMAAEMDKNLSHNGSFSRWSLFPSQEICGEGQLTGQGALQHVLKGMHFSERYVHKHGLFTDDNWHRRVVVHSTEFSRTYQSAVAFTYGMLPSFSIEKLIIELSDNLNFYKHGVFGTACNCGKNEDFRREAETECSLTPRLKENAQDYKALFSYVTELFNISSFTMDKPRFFMDGFSGYMCHNKPFPCTKNGTCINTSMMEALWKIIDTNSDCLAKSKPYKIYARSLTHGLFTRIVKNFNTSIQKRGNANFHLYSGHDETLTPLIAGLELQDNVLPGYAHMITFELWRDSRGTNDGDENSGNEFIRVLQNGIVVTDQLVFCSQQTSDQGMCPFNQFISYLTTMNLMPLCLTKANEDFDDGL